MKFWFDKFRPISWEGKLFYLVVVAVVIWDFVIIKRNSVSVSDTIFNFFPHAGVIFLISAMVIRARAKHFHHESK